MPSAFLPGETSESAHRMSDVETIALEILAEGLDDWVPVDSVIGSARDAAAHTGTDFRSLATATITHLIKTGLMVAGDLGNEGFERWPEPPAAMAHRVIDQCESFGWEPLGAACWLANTAAGDERARLSG